MAQNSILELTDCFKSLEARITDSFNSHSDDMSNEYVGVVSKDRIACAKQICHDIIDTYAKTQTYDALSSSIEHLTGKQDVHKQGTQLAHEYIDGLSDKNMNMAIAFMYIHPETLQHIIPVTQCMGTVAYGLDLDTELYLAVGYFHDAGKEDPNVYDVLTAREMYASDSMKMRRMALHAKLAERYLPRYDLGDHKDQIIEGALYHHDDFCVDPKRYENLHPSTRILQQIDKMHGGIVTRSYKTQRTPINVIRDMFRSKNEHNGVVNKQVEPFFKENPLMVGPTPDPVYNSSAIVGNTLLRLNPQLYLL